MIARLALIYMGRAATWSTRRLPIFFHGIGRCTRAIFYARSTACTKAIDCFRPVRSASELPKNQHISEAARFTHFLSMLLACPTKGMIRDLLHDIFFFVLGWLQNICSTQRGIVPNQFLLFPHHDVIIF